LEDARLRISEIFYSLQGEGSLVGVPSVFVRTSGCNLRCVWCDTPYTSWNPEGESMTIDQIINEVRKYPAQHVVVTGGEPLIADGVVDLTRRLANLGLHITIETAGTTNAAVACDLMSISPKLSNSIPHKRDGGRWAEQHDRLRYVPTVLRRLIQAHPYQLKYVVMSEDDLKEILHVNAEIHADPNHVILMPEGTDPEILHSRSQWLAEVCKNLGFRFSSRLHVDLWGARRGV
jgi:7-carboxy-7-deazaguanine synthase